MSAIDLQSVFTFRITDSKLEFVQQLLRRENTIVLALFYNENTQLLVQGPLGEFWTYI